MAPNILLNTRSDGLPSEPPETEPTLIRALWKTVHQRLADNMASPKTPPHYLKATVASSGKQQGRKDSSTKRHIPKEPLTGLASTQTTPLKSSTKNPNINDRNFRSAVLERHGIIIDSTSQVTQETAYEHFKTLDPQHNGYEGKVKQWYQRNHPDSDVWLTLNNEEAAKHSKQLRILSIFQANEAKVSYRGKQYFFHEDDYQDPDTDTRVKTTYFELEWAPIPDDMMLFRPPRMKPTLEADARPFAFNTKPDCTYWVSTRSINMEYRRSVETTTFVLKGPNCMTPYTTIESKKDQTDFLAAENQLAVASGLILYNRVLLRCRRLRARNIDEHSWKDTDFDEIKHYGVGFNGTEVNFYKATPQLSFNNNQIAAKGQWTPWEGCTLGRIAVYNAADPIDFIKIQRWANEIHNWGLGEYADHATLDVKGILYSRSKSDKISLTSDDMRALKIAGE